MNNIVTFKLLLYLHILIK